MYPTHIRVFFSNFEFLSHFFKFYDAILKIPQGGWGQKYQEIGPHGLGCCMSPLSTDHMDINSGLRLLYKYSM